MFSAIPQRVGMLLAGFLDYASIQSLVRIGIGAKNPAWKI
jgi:hypothetical protein